MCYDPLRFILIVPNCATRCFARCCLRCVCSLCLPLPLSFLSRYGVVFVFLVVAPVLSARYVFVVAWVCRSRALVCHLAKCPMSRGSFGLRRGSCARCLRLRCGYLSPSTSAPHDGCTMLRLAKCSMPRAHRRGWAWRQGSGLGALPNAKGRSRRDAHCPGSGMCELPNVGV